MTVLANLVWDFHFVFGGFSWAQFLAVALGIN